MLIALEGSAPTIEGGVNDLRKSYAKYYVQKTYNMVGSPKFYHQGPAAGSISISMINIRIMADAAVRFINANEGKVFMVGWSRGAAACIQAAHNLKNSGGKKIDAMFLFDPVDMDTSTSSDLNFIPDSVISAYHATATKKNKIFNIFPTCGKRNDPAVNVRRGYFDVSHGQIAGSDGTQGDGGSWKWMEDHMKAEGLI